MMKIEMDKQYRTRDGKECQHIIVYASSTLWTAMLDAAVGEG